MDPAANKGVTIVQEPFSMDFFLARQADAASAMTYNELAQVLESTNPKTGKLYTLKDLNVIPMQQVGTAMLRCVSSLRQTGVGSTVATMSGSARASCSSKVPPRARVTKPG